MLMILKILSSIKSTISNDLLDALLDLGCALLEGGNTIVQTTVYNYFTTNSVSENMFRKLYNTIKTQKDKLNFRGLDYYHKSDDDTEAEIMEKIMTFLQLFCEGHNLDLQKYIRKQTNSQENFDMQILTVDLLKVYCDNLCIGNFENVIKTIDTIIEWIQGPCEVS